MLPQKPNSDFLLYQSEDGRVKIQVRLEDNTVWLTQKTMAELFQTSVPNINMHIKSIFEEEELDAPSTIKDFLIVQTEGNRQVERSQKFYNPDIIISVGYRVKSLRGTQFRILLSPGMVQTSLALPLQANFSGHILTLWTDSN